MVYAKANSVVTAEVDCPVWCHKYIIGKKGADIKNITNDIPKVGPRSASDRSGGASVYNTGIGYCRCYHGSAS